MLFESHSHFIITRRSLAICGGDLGGWGKWALWGIKQICLTIQCSIATQYYNWVIMLNGLNWEHWAAEIEELIIWTNILLLSCVFSIKSGSFKLRMASIDGIETKKLIDTLKENQTSHAYNTDKILRYVKEKRNAWRGNIFRCLWHCDSEYRLNNYSGPNWMASKTDLRSLLQLLNVTD